MRSLVPFAVAAALLALSARDASAQAQALPIVTPLVGPPTVQWLAPPRGDASGPAGDPALAPLRVGLFGDAPATGDPLCAPAGNATAASAGFAPTYTTTMRLVPRLTLMSFSRGGCPLDGAAGGGLVYIVPIDPARNISLALGAGVIHAPHAGPLGRPITRTQLRGDFVFRRPDGRAFTLGVGSRGLSFGGTL